MLMFDAGMQMCFMHVVHVMHMYEWGLYGGQMSQEGVVGATHNKQHKNSLQWSPDEEYASLHRRCREFRVFLAQVAQVPDDGETKGFFSYLSSCEGDTMTMPLLQPE